MGGNVTRVEGRKAGDILMYALSTCVWCKRTKKLLSELGVEYFYVDVDLLQGDERKAVMQEVARWNPARSFPTLVIDQSRSIVGFDEQRIREALDGGE